MALQYEETIEFYKNLDISICGIPKNEVLHQANANMTDAELVAYYSERYADVDVAEFLTKERRERLYGLCNLVKQGEFYLDVGCANGVHMEILHQRGINGIGLDLSIPNILRGRQKYPHLKFIHGFAEEIPFKDNHFEIIILGDVIEHFRNPRISLSECLRVARKGLALCVPIKPEVTAEHINPFSCDEIVNLLKFYKLKVHFYDCEGRKVSRAEAGSKLEAFPWLLIRADRTEQTNIAEKGITDTEGAKEHRQAMDQILSNDEWCQNTEHQREETHLNRFKLLSHLIEGQKVLEVGCGNGDLSIEMAKVGFDIVGIDISGPGVSQAADLAKKENIDTRTQFMVMDATSLEFADNSFDTVLIPEVLEHVRDSRRLIEEAIRVTRNGGRIVISVPNGLLVPFQGHLRVFFKDTLTTELSQHTSEIQWHELPFKKWLVCSFFVRKRELNITKGPAVDILMPTYNGRKYIRRAIKSVLYQTYQNWNLIVVNDGGEDVKDIVDEFQDDRIKYFVTEHKGKAHALNVGIANSDGKFVCYLDDDDILYPIHLEVLIKASSEGKKDFVYSDWYVVSLDENDREIGREFEFRQDVTPWLLIRQNYISNNNFLHTRSLLEKTGMYDEELDIIIDWDMIRRLAFVSEPYHVWGVTSERLRYYNRAILENRITGLWTRSPEKVRRSMERITNKTMNLPATIKELKKAVIDAMLHQSYYHSLELNNALQAKDIQISNLETNLRGNVSHIGNLEVAITEKDTQISHLGGMVSEKDSEVGNLKEMIDQKAIQISHLESVGWEREATLNRIYNSHGWKTLSAYYKARNRLLPVGTRRRKFAVSIFKLLLIAPQIINKANVIRTILFRPKDNCPVTPAEGLGEGGADETRIVDSALSAAGLPITQSSPSLKKPAITRKRILLVSYYCPVRSHAGGLRILDIYRLIKAKFPDVGLDLYTCRHPEIDGSYKDVEDIYDNIFYSTTDELTVSDLLNQCQIRPSYDVIDLQFHQSARHIDEFRTLGAKILFTPMESLARSQFIDAQEAFRRKHRLSLKALAAGVKEATKELKVCLKADEVICVSRSDAAFLRAISLSKKIKYFETGISSIEFQDTLDNLSLTLTPEHKENTILYVAYFGSETNAVALKWYLDNVHPLIKIQVPDYILRVVGRGDLSVFSNYREDSIDFIGEVASIGPYIDKAKVGIAPALGGAGLRGKVNQYAIFGVPSVVSPIAAKGLAYENEVDIFIAEKPEDFAERCVLLLMDNEINKKIGHKARQTAFLNYSWESKLDVIKQTYGLDSDILMNKPKVTVLVPSFNHGRYLRERIESVLKQTYPNVELIVIDDCSEDDSDDVIKWLQAQYGFKFIRNARNSGTPFAAWERIFSLGTGEYIWICESDDYADHRFLEVTVNALMNNKGAVVAYCDSWIVDEQGRKVDHTNTYFHEIWCESRWDQDFVRAGADELNDFQLRGQTVPNMSSALFNSRAFKQAYHPFLKNFRLTGDWLFVGRILRYGSVVFCKQTLNYFRRHAVTSRARVKSARSQAEFILTKYILFRATGRSWREFASVMSTDAVRFLYEPAGFFSVLRALFNISVLKTLQCGASLAASLAMNGHLVNKFWQRYKLIIGDH